MNDGTPDTTPPPAPVFAPLPPLTPESITYTIAGGGALKCDACGALVDDDHGATHTHSLFHAQLGRAVDGLADRFAQLAGAVADADARLALDARAGREVPPGWGRSTDDLIEQFLDAGNLPGGHVRVVLDGPLDQVVPAADALTLLLPLTSASPILRDATMPVREQRVYVVAVDAIRSRLNQLAASRMAAGRPAPAHVPPVEQIAAGDAAAIAHHARALGRHMAELARVAGGAGLPRDVELADYLADLDDMIKGLDTWAEVTARASGAEPPVDAEAEAAQ